VTSDEVVARECIRDTLARYNHAGDRGQLGELAACFTADGVLALGADDDSTGPPEIEARLSRVVSDSQQRSARPLIRHHVSSIEITLEAEGEARVRSYFLVFSEEGLDHWGRYDDRFRACDERWLIAHRRVRIDGAASGSRMLAAFRETTR
jgi:hypothetical protein